MHKMKLLNQLTLVTLSSSGLFSLTSCQESGGSGSGGSSDQQIQCYACGFPKVHPENDMPGSYGSKTYNHSCDEFLSILKRGSKRSQIPQEINRFIRTCPAGVQSCFGATGVYDKKDKDPKNDVHVSFMGCSESKHNHPYGCDTEKQDVPVRDKDKKKVIIKIDVKMCFCSTHLCNHPEGELFSSGEATLVPNISVVIFTSVLLELLMLKSSRSIP